MTLLEDKYGMKVEPSLTATPEVIEPSLRAVEETADYGRFALEPLSRGKGTTIGNSLRRTLLSSIEGAAITWVKIAGVPHEYAPLPGMREDVHELLLNLKGVRIKPLADRPGRLRIEVDGEGEVRAGDIMSSSYFKVVNPGHHLATLDTWDARLSIEMNVEQGVGYREASEDDLLAAGVLPVDAVFSPVRKANFTVENMRTGDREMERLTLEVWTDGTVSPFEALQEASNDLMRVLYSVVNPVQEDEIFDVACRSVPPEVYNIRVEELGLSARTSNSLRRAGVNRVGEVLSMPDSDLLKIRNFGVTSLAELRSRLEELRIVTGTD